MSNESRRSLWDYFKKCVDDPDKKAKCKLCGTTYNYASTIHNLKQHLRRMHPDDVCGMDFYCKNKPRGKGKEALKINDSIWSFFTRSKTNKRIAICNICDGDRSYLLSKKTLIQHLMTFHIDEYRKQSHESSVEEEETDSNETIRFEVVNNEQETGVLDQSNNKTLKGEDDPLWGFFDVEDTKARCAVCSHDVNSDRREMIKHLKKDHPNLVSHIEDDADQELEEDSDKCEDPFTQVVYLEQEFAEEEEEPLTRMKVKPQVRVQPKLLEKRRRMSTYSKEYPREYSVPNRSKHEVVPNDDEDELSIFLKYIKVLLQKLPPEVFGKVQIEIVNLIINAKTKHDEKSLMDISNVNTSFVDLQKNSAGNVTVNDVIASKSMANTSYTITLAPCTSKGVDDTNSSVTVVAESKEN